MANYDFKGREEHAVAYIRRVTNGGYSDAGISNVLGSAREQPGYSTPMSMPKGCKHVYVTAVRTGSEFQYEVRLV